MKRGFTLLELLVVIGIPSILSTVVTLVINPAELLRQTRDVQRLSDFKTLTNALSFYLARASAPNLNVNQIPSPCDEINDGDSILDWYASTEQPSTPGGLGASKQPFFNPGVAVPSHVPIQANIKSVTGNGWVPIDFTTLNPRPLSKLPVDPVNQSPVALQSNSLVGDGYYYAYQCSGFTYEINTNMESTKYAPLEATDGGKVGCSGVGAASPTRCDQPGFTTKADMIYEVGNDPGLDL